MRTKIYFITMALGTAMLACTGGNNSSNPPAATNTVSGATSPTNEMVRNNPALMMTNAPSDTNHMGTNAP